MALAPGLMAKVRIVVADADTATAMGSGDVLVLATPRVLALAEAASMAAITPSLEPGLTSVGTSVAMEHKQASPIGAEVEVEAELTEVEGRRLVFRFIARQKPPGWITGRRRPCCRRGHGGAGARRQGQVRQSRRACRHLQV